MRKFLHLFIQFVSYATLALLTACANTGSGNNPYNQSSSRFSSDYSSRLPQQMNTDGKKMVLVDPNVHAWGAYGSDGQLIKAGIATAGGAVCPPDDNEADCRTDFGTYHITSLGDEGCYSKVYPKPQGGGLMPYCMFFNKGEALHGSPDPAVVEANVSHGCVRMRIPDAEWMRNNFAQVGTKVVILPYNQ
jgi:hypothetical protein